MDTWVWVVVAIALLVLVGLVAWVLLKQRQRAKHVEHRFGPEFDHQVRQRGSKRAAREHLEQVAERRDSLTIHPLDDESREQYLQRWHALQADFVDRPGETVDAADRLVTDVLTERGYPGEDFESRCELMAADHPQVVEQYRQAHDARRRHHVDDGATTEELRRAMVHYRELVTLLVEDAGRSGSHRLPEQPEQPEQPERPA